MNWRSKRNRPGNHAHGSMEQRAWIIRSFRFNHRSSGSFHQRWVAHLLVPFGPRTVQTIKKCGRDPLYIITSHQSLISGGLKIEVWSPRYFCQLCSLFKFACKGDLDIHFWGPFSNDVSFGTIGDLPTSSF